MWGPPGGDAQIMIGILFFLFEFYEDQLLAFMVLTLVWLCEIFTLMRSVARPMLGLHRQLLARHPCAA